MRPRTAPRRLTPDSQICCFLLSLPDIVGYTRTHENCTPIQCSLISVNCTPSGVGGGGGGGGGVRVQIMGWGNRLGEYFHNFPWQVRPSEIGRSICMTSMCVCEGWRDGALSVSCQNLVSLTVSCWFVMCSCQQSD